MLWVTDQAPGNDVLIALLGMAVALSAAYACGRLQQWYRQTTDREDAFRDGYNTAARSLFTMAARTVTATKATARGQVAGRATIVAITSASATVAPFTTVAGESPDTRHYRTDDLSRHVA